jgi:hypothetical protein
MTEDFMPILKLFDNATGEQNKIRLDYNAPPRTMSNSTLSTTFLVLLACNLHTASRARSLHWCASAELNAISGSRQLKR